MKSAIVSAIMMQILNTTGADMNGVAVSEMVCLADNIYHESRGEEVAGQVAVAAVTYNRVKSNSYPDTFCQVVWQKSQFEWTRLKVRHREIDPRAWKLAAEIGVMVTIGFIDDITEGATHFYNPQKADPFWQRSMRETTVIGAHRFLATGKVINANSSRSIVQ